MYYEELHKLLCRPYILWEGYICKTTFIEAYEHTEHLNRPLIEIR